MIKTIVAPEKEMPKNGETLFLAGGITNCPDWQKQIINKLEGDFYVYNPRRENFPIKDPNAAREQITWEYERLKSADCISFWFSKGSLNPIVLYEMGMWGLSREYTKIFIGVDPDYERKQDVEIQTELAAPEIKIRYSIDEMAKDINECFKERKEGWERLGRYLTKCCSDVQLSDRY
jgi:hypothetical protein